MSELEIKKAYEQVNELWRSAKTGDPSALLAIDLAEFVVDYVGKPNGPDAFWTEFGKDLHALAVKYGGNKRAETMIDTIAHALMQTITKAGAA